MVDREHRQVHRRCSAESGYEHQRALLNAPRSALSGILVMDGHDDRDHIDDSKINIKVFQNDLGVIKCYLKNQVSRFTK